MNTIDQFASVLSISGTILVAIPVLASLIGVVKTIPMILAPLGMAMILSAVFIYCSGDDAYA